MIIRPLDRASVSRRPTAVADERGAGTIGFSGDSPAIAPREALVHVEVLPGLTVVRARADALIRRGDERLRCAGDDGQSVDDLSARFGVKRTTIVENLKRYCESGGRIDPAQLIGCSQLSESDRERILQVFQRLGLERLAPVHQELEGTVSYEELHLLRVYLLARRPPQTDEIYGTKDIPISLAASVPAPRF